MGAVLRDGAGTRIMKRLLENNLIKGDLLTLFHQNSKEEITVN